jgi:hypothetical protein
MWLEGIPGWHLWMIIWLVAEGDMRDVVLTDMLAILTYGYFEAAIQSKAVIIVFNLFRVTLYKRLSGTRADGPERPRVQCAGPSIGTQHSLNIKGSLSEK